jgi:hypothetical protein
MAAKSQRSFAFRLRAVIKIYATVILTRDAATILALDDVMRRPPYFSRPVSKLFGDGKASYSVAVRLDSGLFRRPR